MYLPFIVEISGYDTSLGFSQWANKPATRNADVCRIFTPFLNIAGVNLGTLVVDCQPFT